MILLSHFIVGLTSCFLGALPFGAINLSVVSISIRKSYGQGVMFALGASVVEIVEAYVAVAFGMYINQFLNDHMFIPYLIGTIFLTLGIYFFLRKTAPASTNLSRRKRTNFFKGVGVALLNPQAIPFWLFTLAFITPFNLFEFIGLPLVLFLTGVFVGKLIALVGYAKMSNYLESRFTKSNSTIDYIMGAIFLTIGVFQIITHLQ
jgi:threonine/homoserine/homoserine lactone efflux protein